MTSPIAGMACSIDPSSASLLLPIVQAAIMTAPIVFRREIARTIRSVRARRARQPVTPPEASATRDP